MSQWKPQHPPSREYPHSRALAGTVLPSRTERLLLAVVVLIAFTGASPLNPLVIRSERPHGPIPTECIEGLVEAPPRIDVGQAPLTPAPFEEIAPPPPSASLRLQLHEAQEALVRNDRASFDAHVTLAKQMLVSFPRGGERQVAESVVSVYDDVARIWSAQFESPFFARGSNEFAIASVYPGYEEAVASSVWTDSSDRRFYPASETRDFLARVAAQRLAPLGVQATGAPPQTIVIPREPVVPPVRVIDESSREATTRTPSEADRPSESIAAPVETAEARPPRLRSDVPTRRTTVRRAAPRTGQAAARPSDSEPSTKTLAPAGQPAKPQPPHPAAAVPEGAAVTAITPPAGAEVLPRESSLDDAPIASSTSAPVASDLESGSTFTAEPEEGQAIGAESDVDASPEPAASAVSEPSAGRRLFLPIVLILIAIGVVVLLLRSRL